MSQKDINKTREYIPNIVCEEFMPRSNDGSIKQKPRYLGTIRPSSFCLVDFVKQHSQRAKLQNVLITDTQCSLKILEHIVDAMYIVIWPLS